MAEFVYVLPKGDDWEVRVGETGTSIEYDSKHDAMVAGRAVAIVLEAELQPHDEEGRIQDPDSFGNDPEESEG